MGIQGLDKEKTKAWFQGWVVTRKGGPGSGHWGHAGGQGGPGNPGGSMPRSAAMSIATGRDWKQRRLDKLMDAFSSGEARDARRAKGYYDVISETDEESAKILLTQGMEPSFKPQIAELTSYAPGKGLERNALYVANDGAFSRGSFGKVRLYVSTKKDSLSSPQEMKQLGREDVDDVLGTSNGAIVANRAPKSIFVAVEVKEGGKWQRMTPEDYLKSVGVDPNTPRLPSVPKYRAWVEKNAKAFALSPKGIEETVHDYNRASLEDKLWMAKDADLLG